ncbi:hypothetical protein [Solibacillus sp. NPDC093137]|uniref:hypothetical protein n=1 Tax=Solibacillus sp. NPDC093137 TaxID=3390678 RepID=UPI003D08E1EB
MTPPTFTAVDYDYFNELGNNELNNSVCISEGLQVYFEKYLSDTYSKAVTAQHWNYFENNLYSLSSLLIPTLKLYQELERHFKGLINLSVIYGKLSSFTATNISMLVSADVLLNPHSLAEEDFTIVQARHIHKAIIGILLMEKAFLHLEKNLDLRFELERSYIRYYLFEVNQTININAQHESSPHALHSYYAF